MDFCEDCLFCYTEHKLYKAFKKWTKKSYWLKLRNNEQLMAGYKCKYATCIP